MVRLSGHCRPHPSLQETRAWPQAQRAASALRALGIEAEQAARLVALPLSQLLPMDGSLVARAAKELTVAKNSGRASTAKRVRARG